MPNDTVRVVSYEAADDARIIFALARDPEIDAMSDAELIERYGRWPAKRPRLRVVNDPE